MECIVEFIWPTKKLIKFWEINFEIMVAIFDNETSFRVWLNNVMLEDGCNFSSSRVLLRAATFPFLRTRKSLWRSFLIESSPGFRPVRTASRYSTSNVATPSRGNLSTKLWGQSTARNFSWKLWTKKRTKLLQYLRYFVFQFRALYLNYLFYFWSIKP